MANRQYGTPGDNTPSVVSTHYGHLVGCSVPDWDDDEPGEGIPSSDNFGRRNCKPLPSTYPSPRKGR